LSWGLPDDKPVVGKMVIFFVFIQTGPGKDRMFPHLFTQELRLQ
jgi:hypothetical protein